MTSAVFQALNGYAKAATAAAPAPAETPKTDFAAFMGDAARDAVGTLKAAEQASVQGALGRMDAQSVVEAVTAAEMTVQTVTAVRDKVIEAYQELARMPI